MNHFYAIDFGSSKFCAARLSLDDNEQITDVDVLSVRSTGMKRGEPVDIPAVKDGLNKLLEHAETQWGCDIQRVALNIPCKFVSIEKTTCSLNLKGRAVRESHCHKLLEAAKVQVQDEKLFLLKTIAEAFSVDGREDVQNPVGFTGDNLSGSFMHLLSERHMAHDLIKICNDAGVQVVELVPQGLASALGSGLVDSGVDDFALVDLGAGCCQGAIFQQGKLRQFIKIPIGGDHFTNDLMSGLGIIRNDAERVKEIYGMSKGVEGMSCSTIDNQERLVKGDDAIEILGPRLAELGDFLSNSLRSAEPVQKLSCLYVTGGGSNMRNLPKTLSHLMKKPVMRVTPIVFSQRVAQVQNTGSKFTNSESYTNSAVLGALYNYAFGYPGTFGERLIEERPEGLLNRLRFGLRFFI